MNLTVDDVNFIRSFVNGILNDFFTAAIERNGVEEYINPVEGLLEVSRSIDRLTRNMDDLIAAVNDIRQ